MSERPQRLDHLRRTAAVAGLGAGLGVIGLAICGGYLLAAGVEGGHLTIFVGVGVVGLSLLAVSLYLLVKSLVELGLKIEATSFRIYDNLREIVDFYRDDRKQLQTIADNVQLSDTARALAHRDRERAALRLAINEEIVRGDIEAAYALVEQLEARHGYRNEAARLRREVDLCRARETSYKLQEAVEQVRRHIAAQEWDRARREMDRLLAQHPNNSDVLDLPKLFTIRRGDHKRRLLKEWDQSVQRNEVDRGIAILRELDQYLTPNEAAALEESARGVFRTKLHNLGLQFSLAVSEHNWREALAVGREIVEEFPNSRMAGEVRERLDVLARRAEEMEEAPAAAAAPQD